MKNTLKEKMTSSKRNSWRKRWLKGDFNKYQKKKTRKQIEKELKIINVAFYLIFFFCLLLIILFFFVFYQIGLFNKKFLNSELQNKSVFEITNLTYENLTDKEIDFFNSIFKDVNPIYLVNNHNIIITKNITNYCDDCEGVNKKDGELIAIKYLEDEGWLKEVICHELLHSFFLDDGEYSDGSYTLNHQIIYDLGEKFVCFDKVSKLTLIFG